MSKAQKLIEAADTRRIVIAATINGKRTLNINSIVISENELIINGVKVDLTRSSYIDVSLCANDTDSFIEKVRKI